MMNLLALLFFLTPSPTAVPTGDVSGRVILWKAGALQPDASNAVVWIEGQRRGSSIAGTVRAEMKSEGKKFSPRVVVVPKNAAVEFPNMDPIFHNVFSVSGANRFDLGLYRSGASKANPFRETGLARVYCNIHPTMVGFVMIVDSDFAAVTGQDGTFRLEGVPAGSHVLKVWHEEGGDSRISVTVRPRASAAADVRLDVSGYRFQPHKNKYGKDYPPPPPDDERY